MSFTIGGAESGTSAGKPQPDSSTDSAPPAAPTHLAPFPVQAQPSHLPLLPRGKRPTFSRHRHDANPALAVKVLQDIQMAVEAWHQDLRQTVQRIQALYMEGPIVDGWLETIDDQSGKATAIDSALLRHGDPQDLSGYVDRLCQLLESPDPPSSPGQALGRPGYRLCNLDSDGRVQHFPCPPEQLSTISLAIARYQKLRQLLDHKQFLEAKLKRTVEVMTSSRDALGIAPMCSSEPEVGE
ncbi:hypothetical protein C8255_06450 [filamentous cyanobacterium CCP3]|nr:hypothetical protein C8255_06450 [filamentous cyanobacterium CCP3]